MDDDPRNADQIWMIGPAVCLRAAGHDATRPRPSEVPRASVALRPAATPARATLSRPAEERAVRALAGWFAVSVATPAARATVAMVSWKDAIVMYRSAFPDLTYGAEDLFGAGDKVVLRWTATATDTIGFMGRPPTGRQAAVTGINIYRLSGGLLVEHWDEWDLAGLLRSSADRRPARPAAEHVRAAGVAAAAASGSACQA